MTYNVLILGGGPAGLSTALHLKQRAPHLADRILLLEKEHYPRFKLCAGGLTADTEILLERLGLDVSEVPHVDATAMQFDFEGKGLRIALAKKHTLRIIRRDEFDAWLAKKTREAGVEIREGVTVKDVRPDAEGVTVCGWRGRFERSHPPVRDAGCTGFHGQGVGGDYPGPHPTPPQPSPIFR